MTPAKKRTKPAEKPAPKKHPFLAVLNMLKMIGKGIIGLFKFLFNFIIKLLQIILKFVPLAIASIALLMVCAALSVYLLSATIGLKNNPDWQEYLSGHVQEWVQAEKEIRGEKVEEVVVEATEQTE